MLEPYTRQHLLEILRPPAGYTLDEAIGTTFSLDLLTLLSAPLAFALFDWEDIDGRPIADPLALLQAVRSYADKIMIFCQATRISVPAKSHHLYSYLESSVVEVHARNQAGVFHPKVWILRFTTADGRVLYRVLCLSRNLTFDHSWDTALILEGEIAEQSGVGHGSAPLADFVAALPELALRPLSPEAAKRVMRMQAELRNVVFECPPGFDDLRFWPMGYAAQHRLPFPDAIDRLLVMSPFLTEDLLAGLVHRSKQAILISRLEEVQKLPRATLDAFEAVYVLHPHADPDVTDEADADVDGVLTNDSQLHGLHAKLYVAECGQRVHLLTGSANATHAAFWTNVELLVEMQGPRTVCGIDALLTPATTETTLQSLLTRYVPLQNAADSDLRPANRLEQIVDQYSFQLAYAGLQAHVLHKGSSGQFGVVVQFSSSASVEIPLLLQVRCRPITLHVDRTMRVGNHGPELARFEGLHMDELTTFFAFTVQADDGIASAARQFVLNIPLVGQPPDRREQLLRLMLSNRDYVLRLLLFMLAGDSLAARSALLESRALERHTNEGSSGALGFPLFEALVRALDMHPDKISQVNRLVMELRQTSGERDLLPENFDLIWEPIWAAYEQRRS